MKHLIPLTSDQITVVRRSLKSSLKFADSEYIDEVDSILKTIRENSSLC